MKPLKRREPRYIHLVELQDKVLQREIIALRRQGPPPVTARLLAMLSALEDIQSAFNEAQCRVPDGDADTVAGRNTFQALVKAYDELWAWGRWYAVIEARQAMESQQARPASKRRAG